MRERRPKRRYYGATDRAPLPSPHRSQAGYTLLEVVLVIFIIAFISGVAFSNFDSVFGWKQKGEIRRFVDTWEFLFNEALARRQGYRLVINIDDNSYYVLREVQPEADEAVQVDTLKNLRTKGEQKRREEAELENLPTLEEEYALQDQKESGDLETLFFEAALHDPQGQVRLGKPLAYPSLADKKQLATGLSFKKITTPRGKHLDGTAYIRFSPRGGSEFAIVQIKANEQIYSTYMNPSTGGVSFRQGEHDFEWLKKAPS